MSYVETNAFGRYAILAYCDLCPAKTPVSVAHGRGVDCRREAGKILKGLGWSFDRARGVALCPQCAKGENVR